MATMATKKVATMATKAGPSVPGVRPDFSGVPGELVDLDASLSFARVTRSSPYDPLLQKLLAATESWRAETKDGSAAKPQPGLRFSDTRARAAITSRSRKLNMRVSFAESGGQLFVRYEGALDAEKKLPDGRRGQVIGILKRDGAHTTLALTQKLRNGGDTTVDASIVESICSQMLRKAEVGSKQSPSGQVWCLPQDVRGGGITDAGMAA